MSHIWVSHASARLEYDLCHVWMSRTNPNPALIISNMGYTILMKLQFPFTFCFESTPLFVCSGFIHPPLQSLVNWYFFHTFEWHVRKRNVKSKAPITISGFSFRFLTSNESDPFDEISGFITTLLERHRKFLSRKFASGFFFDFGSQNAVLQ